MSCLLRRLFKNSLHFSLGLFYLVAENYLAENDMEFTDLIR